MNESTSHDERRGLPDRLLDRRALLIIGAVALAAQLLHLYVAEQGDLFHGLFLDSKHYAERARALRDGLACEAPYLLSPLYPYLLTPFVDGAGRVTISCSASR